MLQAIKGGIKKNKFSKFVLNALQGMDQGGIYTVEKGIAVIQARENDTACNGTSCQRRGAARYAELPR